MIGYYVHHHGQGHLARAECVAAAAVEPVVALSSLPEPATHPFAGWIALPADPAVADADDPTGGGALHWAPLNSPGYRARMAVLARWADAASPRLVVVDVSVEVTALLRLLAVPVVVVAGPGRRDDDPHRLAHDLAARVVAPWPELDVRSAAVVHAGAFSRFDGRPVLPVPGHRRVLLLFGAGGTDVPATALRDAAAATPDWTWRAVGGSTGWVGAERIDIGWLDDVWDELMAADVVVTHAGLSALAEVAAARRPAVVLPQDRPFGEQRDTAARLARAGLAEVHERWPVAADWPAILESASARGGAGWSRWNDGGGACRFVAALDLPVPKVRVA